MKIESTIQTPSKAYKGRVEILATKEQLQELYNFISASKLLEDKESEITKWLIDEIKDVINVIEEYEELSQKIDQY